MAAEDRVCLNADMTADVPCDSVEARYVYSREDAERIVMKNVPAPAADKAVRGRANKRAAAGR